MRLDAGLESYIIHIGIIKTLACVLKNASIILIWKGHQPQLVASIEHHLQMMKENYRSETLKFGYCLSPI